MPPDYEAAVQRVYEAVLDHGDLALDVGAHIGRHTFPMAASVGAAGRVLAFEPLDDCRRQLIAGLRADSAVSAQRTAVYGGPWGGSGVAPSSWLHWTFPHTAGSGRGCTMRRRVSRRGTYALKRSTGCSCRFREDGSGRADGDCVSSRSMRKAASITSCSEQSGLFAGIVRRSRSSSAPTRLVNTVLNRGSFRNFWRRSVTRWSTFWAATSVMRMFLPRVPTCRKSGTTSRYQGKSVRRVNPSVAYWRAGLQLDRNVVPGWCAHPRTRIGCSPID